MMTVEEIQAALEDRNLSKVADKVGYTRAYLALIRSGKVKNPSHKFVVALSSYLEPLKNDQ